MTGSEDSQQATRPISVAELLAKNGTIGAPVGGGRRRKRRGNADAVTVAELTGEIPIVRIDDSGAIPIVVDDSAAETPEPEAGANGQAVDVEHTEARVAEPSPLERAPEPTPRRGRDAPPERSAYPRPIRPHEEPAPVSDAEAMSPDPIDDVDDVDVVDVGAAEDTAQTDGVVADELGLGDTGSAVGEALLFGGDTMADELARGAAAVEPIAGDLSDDLVDDPQTAEELDDADLSEAFGEDDEKYADYREPTRAQLIGRGALAALQSVLAVAFGAGLFLAFDRLWLWNSMVAMVLAILATLGLVAAVWVVRKTEDIASTLIAVGVGLLVTFGPLALMHAI